MCSTIAVKHTHCHGNKFYQLQAPDHKLLKEAQAAQSAWRAPAGKVGSLCSLPFKIPCLLKNT